MNNYFTVLGSRRGRRISFCDYVQPVFYLTGLLHYFTGCGGRLVQKSWSELVQSSDKVLK